MKRQAIVYLLLIAGAVLLFFGAFIAFMPQRNLIALQLTCGLSIVLALFSIYGLVGTWVIARRGGEQPSVGAVLRHVPLIAWLAAPLIALPLLIPAVRRAATSGHFALRATAVWVVPLLVVGGPIAFHHSRVTSARLAQTDRLEALYAQAATLPPGADRQRACAAVDDQVHAAQAQDRDLYVSRGWGCVMPNQP